jgi:flagellar protein FlbD
MIRVTRLDGTEFVLNAELIELVEHTPDSVITLVNGNKFVVREPLAEIYERVLAYRRRIFAPDGVPVTEDHRVERSSG